MESYDSSPNYMRATSSFDAKKENSQQGGSECDDMISVASSTCGSSVNGPFTPKINTNGIKNRTNKNKPLKNYGNVRSFRRRAKSRIIQSPITISDEDSLVDSSNESSPHYSKSTSSSQGKKSEISNDKNSSISSRLKPASLGHKSLPTLSRTSSLRNVRILIKKTSFKPKRSLLNYSKDVAVNRATYSSTLKGSKFVEPVEVCTRRSESEKNPALKVCGYHHCSLHGHCRGSDEDTGGETKRFLNKKRRSLKKQKSIVPRGESSHSSSGRKKNIQKSPIISIVEQVSRDKNVVDSYEEIYPKPEVEVFGDGYENIQELDFLEVAFGEVSFPERSYQETLDISRKYSLFEPRGYCSRCSFRNEEQFTTNPKQADGDLSLRKATSSSLSGYNNEIPHTGLADVDKNTNEQAGNYIVDSASLSCANEEFNKDCPDTPLNFDEVRKKSRELSSASHGQISSDNNSEEEREFTSNAVDEVKQVEDYEKNTPTHEVGKLQFSNQRHISMWHLIHQHMSSNLVVEPTNKPPLEGADGENPMDGADSFLAKESTNVGSTNNDSENQEIELRKMLAIKLVREAIEKILLPEVQDQTSDDQSVASESTPRAELMERNKIEANTEENIAESNADKGENNVPSIPKEETLITDDASSREIKKNEKVDVRKSENKAPKHWSNLKKWILLQRFIRALEKVRKFNPKKPQLLPLNPDPEAEKVNLRPQTVDGRKNAEEWMLDYALRQAVGQLAPTQKKKVALLVKAFETVVPTKEEPQVQYRTPRLKSDEGQNKDEAIVDKKAVPAGDDKDSENQESGVEETELVAKVKNLQEKATSDPIVGKTEENSECIQRERKNNIEMWHMIYQHVVSGIAEKIGSQLLDGGADDESSKKNHVSNDIDSEFTKSDALKLVKEAVDEILLPEIEDDTQSVTSEEVPKFKNWSKLKNYMLLKRSIKALEKARNVKSRQPQVTDDSEQEKIELRRQMMDERKKAEQWMLDYAVRHIVTKLTPDRKRRVFMLVEAFEAVVPFPDM